MNVHMPPLAIVQARIGASRLPGKMLMDLGGRPLIYWAWKAASDAFGLRNVVVALPSTSDNDGLASVCEGFGAQVFRPSCPEYDVLTRVWLTAHRHRWHPDSLIVRVTPDDPFKEPQTMRWVAAGERHPVELGGEAFTLAMLDRAYAESDEREHLTNALFSTPPPPPPPGVWTVDTVEDLEAARALVAERDTA